MAAAGPSSDEPAVAASAGEVPNSQPSNSLNRGTIMEVLRFIQRKVEWVLAHDVFERFRRNRPATPARLCQFGHAVFSGNNLCSYGHRAA
jgi:hypothetical protein